MYKYVFSLLVLMSFSQLNAAEWMQWRGPNHDGVSTETGLLASWPEADCP